MEIDIYEIEEPLGLLDRKDWRAALQERTGNWHSDTTTYDKGDVITFTFEEYVDADRAGFCGYVSKSVEIPVSVLREAYEALSGNLLPRREA